MLIHRRVRAARCVLSLLILATGCRSGASTQVATRSTNSTAAGPSGEALLLNTESSAGSAEAMSREAPLPAKADRGNPVVLTMFIVVDDIWSGARIVPLGGMTLLTHGDVFFEIRGDDIVFDTPFQPRDRRNYYPFGSWPSQPWLLAFLVADGFPFVEVHQWNGKRWQWLPSLERIDHSPEGFQNWSNGRVIFEPEYIILPGEAPPENLGKGHFQFQQIAGPKGVLPRFDLPLPGEQSCYDYEHRFVALPSGDLFLRLWCEHKSGSAPTRFPSEGVPKIATVYVLHWPPGEVDAIKYPVRQSDPTTNFLDEDGPIYAHSADNVIVVFSNALSHFDGSKWSDPEPLPEEMVFGGWLSDGSALFGAPSPGSREIEMKWHRTREGKWTSWEVAPLTWHGESVRVRLAQVWAPGPDDTWAIGKTVPSKGQGAYVLLHSRSPTRIIDGVAHEAAVKKVFSSLQELPYRDPPPYRKRP